MPNKKNNNISRRDVLTMVGKVAGGSAMYGAMQSLGFAAQSSYTGPVKLDGAPKGTSVLILGAGLAGLVSALELRNAGYKVQVLEYNKRAGGRAWTIRGGDEYTELGGVTQRCEFDKGLYFNPGPWRIPVHHYGILDYARRFNVPLEPFIQTNYNAYVHSADAFGGAPQRYRHIRADYAGHVTELLGKAVNANRLDDAISDEDKEKLLDSLRSWGALDKNLKYVSSGAVSRRRGYDVQKGGGLMPSPVDSTPIALRDILQSGVWQALAQGEEQDHHSNIFQPVGGMDQIAQAIYRQIAKEVKFNARVTKIDQGPRGVTVTYAEGDTIRQAKADWCVCTIPLSILSQIELTASAPMQAAIRAVPYEAAVKVGLQFKRKFWEQDDSIYGGISYTDQPNRLISYPSTGYGQPGKGVLLGAYVFGPNAYELTSLDPKERVRVALHYGSKIHPQYLKEFDNGISVAWHRVPFTNGCAGNWPLGAREIHYENLCAVDGRIVLAGEHASMIFAWQEGAVLSALDAIKRLHEVIKSTAGAKA